MMRLALLIPFLVPGLVSAELFEPASAPDRVVVHPDLARVSREITLEMPAGEHQIRLSDLPQFMDPNLLDAEIEGATILTQTLRDTPTQTAEWLAGSPEVQAAEAALRAAQDAIAALAADVAETEALAQGAEARIDFLTSLGQPEDQAIDVQALRDLGAAIAEDTAVARQEAIAARADIRALRAREPELRDALTLAQATHARVVEPYDKAQEVTFTVSVPAAGPVTLNLEYWTSGAFWQPQYALDFDSAANVLTMNRAVRISQNTGEDWSNIALSVTTVPARSRTAPSVVTPRRLVIADAGRSATSSVLPRAQSGQYADPVIEAPVIVEDAGPLGAGGTFVRASGVGVTYDFVTPVTLQTDADGFVTLDLSPLTFDAQAHARAVPLRDDTAYRILTLTNGSSERILSGAEAVARVDGQVIGTVSFDTIEPGEEVDLSFGPLRGVQLTRAILDKQDGDRGIIARENARNEELRITVENLTDAAWEVTLVDQVPFAEQEDLEINWSAAPLPTRENVEDQRGILEWDFTLPAGQTQTIGLKTDIRWPSDKVLR